MAVGGEYMLDSVSLWQLAMAMANMNMSMSMSLSLSIEFVSA